MSKPLFLTTNVSQMFPESSRPINYPVGDLNRLFRKLTGPCDYTLHSNPIPQQMLQNGLCGLFHMFHKQVPDVSQHVFVTVHFGILTPPLIPLIGTYY